jgi:YegS/Rv2252/BmrU family lipid kinase
MGGDGTFNEVANGLFETGAEVPLGLVPSGHGSDLVRSTETPKKFDAALQHCLNGNHRRIDVGRLEFADGSIRRFLNMAGLGFDACVAERALSIRMPGSTLPYLWSIASTLKGYHNIHVAIETDGEIRTTRAASVLVANGQFLGGGMHMAPMADLQDGLLDLAILGDLTKAEMVREVPNVYRGKHTGHPKFLHLRAKSIRVESIEPARVQADGELVGTAPVTFTVEPGALLLAG